MDPSPHYIKSLPNNTTLEEAKQLGPNGGGVCVGSYIEDEDLI
jgi:hypothetical protein